MKKLSVLLLDSFQIREIISHYKLMSSFFCDFFYNFYSTVYRAITVIKIWRRGWDLNPRILSYRRFSRPVHSAALPPLRYLFFTYRE